MAAWYASGGAMLAVVLGMGVEAVALVLLYRRTGRGIAPGYLLSNLGAGACLLGAAGVAMAGAAWPVIALLLLGGLGLHVLDLWLRWE